MIPLQLARGFVLARNGHTHTKVHLYVTSVLKTGAWEEEIWKLLILGDLTPLSGSYSLGRVIAAGAACAPCCAGLAAACWQGASDASTLHCDVRVLFVPGCCGLCVHVDLSLSGRTGPLSGDQARCHWKEPSKERAHP